MGHIKGEEFPEHAYKLMAPDERKIIEMLNEIPQME